MQEKRIYNGQRDDEGRPEGLGVLIVDITAEVAEGASFKYAGEFQGEVPHGQGVMTFKDGSQYIGNFKEGAKHGLGMMFDVNGNEFESGFWANGKFIDGCEMAIYNESGIAGGSIMQTMYDSVMFAEILAQEEFEEDVALQNEVT